MAKRRYGSIDMPGRFVLEVMTGSGVWVDWGLYDAADFVVGKTGPLEALSQRGL
jgi:hypothetical protein